MSLALVPRSARALAEHLNRYYRVFRAIDPDSVALRLPAGGSFEVQHSVTAAPLFRVTDAGMAVPAGAIDSTMIADGTITGADIATATITPDKLTGATGIPAGAITTVEIANGTILGADIASGTITSANIADGTITSTDIAPNAITRIWSVAGTASSPQALTTGAPGLITDMSLAITATGGELWFLFDATTSHSQLGQATTFALYLDESQMMNRVYSTLVVGASVAVALSHQGPVAAGPYTVQARWSVTGGTATSPGIQRRLTVVELKR